MANLPKNPRSNCYFGCEEGGPLHHFPKPENDTERFDAWKEVLEQEIKDKGNMYIYNQLRLCNKHFEDYYKSPSHRLTRNAVPTLFITKDMCTRSSTPTDMCVETEPHTSPTGDHFLLIVQDTESTMTQKFVKDISTCSQVHLKPSTSAVPVSSVSAPLNQKGAKNTLMRKSVIGLNSDRKDLYRVIKRLSQKVIKLTEICKTQRKKIRAAKKLTKAKPFIKIIESMPDSLKTFMTMQLKSKQKPRGRKFTLEEKIIAESILKQSPKSYAFLSKLMVVPSKRTLQRIK